MKWTRYTSEQVINRLREAEMMLAGGRIEKIVRAHPRYGYRMVLGRLRLGGWRVNPKPVHRLCRQEGLRVPRKQRRRRRLGVSANGIDRRRATRPNDV